MQYGEGKLHRKLNKIDVYQSNSVQNWFPIKLYGSTSLSIINIAMIGFIILISLSSIFVCLQLLIKGRLGLGDEEDYAVPQRVRN